MAEDPKAKVPKPVQFSEFVGQVSNLNPHRLAPGELLSQLNCGADRAGELACRLGAREVIFDN